METNNNKQAFANLLKANCQNLNETTLHEIAYMGYIATEQGGHQQVLCQRIYLQLINGKFKATAENYNQLADLVDITIENLRIINYGTLDNPYYRKAFFSALEAILPTTKEAIHVLNDLIAQFGRGWKTRPQKKNPLAEETTRHLAHVLQKNYKAYNLRSDADREILIESWKKLITLGKLFYPNPTGSLFNAYDIHYPGFITYISRGDRVQYNYLAVLTYSMARMIPLATQNFAQPQSDADFCFLATLEAVLGHEVAGIFLDQTLQAAA